MNREPYKRAAQLIQDAFHQSGIFRRGPPRDLLEQELYRHEQRTYLVLGAGLSAGDAEQYFRANRTRQRAILDYPLWIRRNGTADVLLCLRPLENADDVTDDEALAPLVPEERYLGNVAMLAGHFRFRNLPNNDVGLNSLRWEYDPTPLEAPIEPWLRPWASRLHCNPAHPRSHLHVNTVTERGIGEPERGRRAIPGGREGELRLAVGSLNPLLLLLSIACWVRRLPA